MTISQNRDKVPAQSSIANLPRSPHCRHCRRRRAAQSRRHRLKLPDRDLFQWAEEHVL
jgi:hypothetical protein